MAETWNKKEREKKKKQKKKQKEERKQDRLETAKSKDPNDIFSYVDEYGNVSSTPPDPTKKFAIKLEDVEIGVPKRQAADPADLIRRETGTFFNTSKGYGFIEDAETKQSVFVHVNGLEEEVKEFSKVIFEVEMGPKGASAYNVKIDRGEKKPDKKVEPKAEVKAEVNPEISDEVKD